MGADLYTRTYAKHFAMRRGQAREHRQRIADPAVAARAREADRRWAVAIKQTRGNVQAAHELVQQWEAADEGSVSPCRTLALADDGEVEITEQENG